MIRAILKANTGLMPAFLVMAALLCSPAWWGARRRAVPLWPAVLFAASLAGEFTATLHPTGRHAAASHVCSYSRDVAAAFADQQGLMNVAMYVPVALFAVLAFGRPLIVLAGCWLLSAVTETLQALIPHIGRACDSQDFVTNATGAAIGVALACAWRAIRRSLPMPTKREAVWSIAPLLIGAAVLLTVHRDAISPEWADAPLTVSHSPAQRRLADQDARLLFGPSAHVVNVQDQAALRETPELVIVTTATGNFTIEWPSGQLYDGFDGPVSLPPDGGSDQEARGAADAFARRWFPRSLPGSTVTVRKPHPAEGRRTVEYRRYTGGLLEPMRLDIEVDPGGRIVRFLSRDIPDPKLPAATVTREGAIATVTALHPGTVRNALLLAVRVDRQWRPCWSVTIATSSSPDAPGVPYQLDAVTGRPVMASAN
ncbi:VanZ family protein [Kitasatospora sp. HPMI-4]|uniref:VanZ family protein n=1 Tax=Kitasatospora sp. HPMI-4 TaxID=3448443 RepID=UPI003F1D9D4B